jgi:hypothetical protein
MSATRTSRKHQTPQLQFWDTLVAAQLSKVIAARDMDITEDLQTERKRRCMFERTPGEMELLWAHIIAFRHREGISRPIPAQLFHRPGGRNV